MIKKRILISFCLILVILPVIYFKYKKYESEKVTIETGMEKSSISIKDIVAINKGKEEFEKDTFLIINPETVESWSDIYFNVVPGKYLAIQKFKYTYEYAYRGTSDSEKEIFQEAKILFYNLDDRKLAKTVDTTKWLKENPLYYTLLGCDIFLTETGDYYLERQFFQNDQTLGTSSHVEERTKRRAQPIGITAYFNLSTDQELLEEWSEEKPKETPDFYYKNPDWEKNYATFWKDFNKKRNYSFMDRKEFELWKKKKPNYFDVSTYKVPQGTVLIDLSTTALPKENTALYTRFPDLKQYRDQKWQMVEIFLTEELTKEEVAAMFVDESK
jgi:hypothetical protein